MAQADEYDLFNWQDEVKDMISQLEFVRMVDVQTETVESYIREGKIKADLDYKLKVREDILLETDGPMLKHGIQELQNQKIILPGSKKSLAG